MSHQTRARLEDTTKEVVRFSFLMALVFPILFGVAIPMVRSGAWPLWPWVLGWCLTLCGWKFPSVIRPLYTLWMGIGTILGWCTTRLALGIVFFFLVTPYGYIMRWAKRDPLHRSFEGQKKSYRAAPPPPSSFSNPF